MRVILLFFSLIIPLAQAELTPNSLKQAPSSVVSIYVEYPYQSASGEPARAFGTGAVISDKGYILTNHHVISQASSIAVETSQGHRSYAKPVGAAPDFDIAILKIEPSASEQLSEIKYGSYDNLSIGDSVAVIGNPFGFDQTFTKGVVSNLDRHISLGTQVKSFIQIDAAVNPGNSGGPLLNQDGEFVGIVTGIYGPRLQTSFNIGIALAIPVTIVKPVVEQIINQGHASPGWLGISTQALTPELRAAFTQKENAQGVLVSEVIPRSPAAKANLAERDIITRVNGESVQSPHQLSSLVTAFGSNSNLNLEVIRDNKILKTTSKIGSPRDFMPTADHGPWGLTLAEYQHAVLGGGKESGVFIEYVAPHSAAALQGLENGDKIISLNNIQVKRLKSLEEQKISKQTAPILKIKRDDRIFFVTL
jgi:S1-C subfamily serine protease